MMGAQAQSLALDIITIPVAGGTQLEDIFAVMIGGPEEHHFSQFYQIKSSKMELEATTQDRVKVFWTAFLVLRKTHEVP